MNGVTRRDVKKIGEGEERRDSFSWSRASVCNMLMTEWNWDDALAVRYEEGREQGIEQGMEKGHEKVIELIEQGFSVDEVKQLLNKKKYSVC